MGRNPAMVVRASGLYLSLLPFCTVGLLAVQCLLGDSKRVPFTQQANCFPTPPRTDSLMILAILRQTKQQVKVRNRDRGSFADDVGSYK
jgi:hypothetical protein